MFLCIIRPVKSTTVSRLRTAEASEIFDELRQGSLEPIALLSNSEIVGYLVSRRLWESTQAADPDQDAGAALMRIEQLARLVAGRLEAPPPQPAQLPSTPRPPGRPAKGGPISAPDTWAPARMCEDCGKRVYTTWAEDRHRCRACEKKERNVGWDHRQHCSVQGCVRRIFVKVGSGRTTCRAHEREGAELLPPLIQRAVAVSVGAAACRRPWHAARRRSESCPLTAT